MKFYKVTAQIGHYEDSLSERPGKIISQTRLNELRKGRGYRLPEIYGKVKLLHSLKAVAGMPAVEAVESLLSDCQYKDKASRSFIREQLKGLLRRLDDDPAAGPLPFTERDLRSNGDLQQRLKELRESLKASSKGDEKGTRPNPLAPERDEKKASEDDGKIIYEEEDLPAEYRDLCQPGRQPLTLEYCGDPNKHRGFDEKNIPDYFLHWSLKKSVVCEAKKGKKLRIAKFRRKKADGSSNPGPAKEAFHWSDIQKLLPE